MNMHYNLKLNKKTESYVDICFWSKEICEICLIQIKFFYSHIKFNELNPPLMYVHLNEEETKTVTLYFPEKKQIYTSVDFLIKDKTHETQYAVQIPLDGTELKSTEMIYGE